MNFEEVMLSQSQKDKYCVTPLTRVFKVVKLIETESKDGSQGLGLGEV